MCSRLRIGSASMPSSPSRPGDGRADALLERGGVARDRRRRARRTSAGSTAAGPRSSPACRSSTSAASRRRWMRAPSWSHSASPLRQVAAVAAANSSTRLALARGLAGVDPGLEVLGPQLRKRQQQVGDVALGVDGDRRHAVDARPPRAATGTGRSCRCRSCRRRPRGWSGRASRRAGRRRAVCVRRVVLAAEVEDAELFVGREGHGRRFLGCRERRLTMAGTRSAAGSLPKPLSPRGD